MECGTVRKVVDGDRPWKKYRTGCNGGEIYRLKRMETLTRKFFLYLTKFTLDLFLSLSRSCLFEEN